MNPNPTPDAYYNQVAIRFASLTLAQRLRVKQRIRVKAVVAPSVYLMALDAAIDLELNPAAPDPVPCPEHKPFGEVATRPPCVVHPPGPLAENPKWK